MHIVWYFKVPPDDSEVQPGLRKTLAWNNYYTVVCLFIFQNYSVSPENSGSCLPHPHPMVENREIRDVTDGSVLYIMKNVKAEKKHFSRIVNGD